MDITALQNNGIMALDNTTSVSNLLASYTKNGNADASTDSDSVSISDQARQLFAQSYGQYNGLVSTMQSADGADSLLQSVAQSYTASGKVSADATAQTATESAPAAEQTQSAAPAPAEGSGSGGQGSGGGSSEADSAEQDNIRQQISALQSRVSMLSATLAAGDTTAYGQIASLEAQISSLTASLRA